jgi:peroxin-10
VDFLVNLAYFGLTTGRGTFSIVPSVALCSYFSTATQTLGEEYTGIYPATLRTRLFPAGALRALLILVPSLPSYLLARFGSHIPSGSKLRSLTALLEVATELNLAAFYIRGAYHDLSRRLLGVRYVRLLPPQVYSVPQH